MSGWVIVISICIPLAIVVIAGRTLYSNRKMRAKIRQSVGEIPQPKRVSFAQAYWECCRGKRTAAEKVDDHTWNNLDMDTVYQRLNACQSEAGDVLLYRRLRSRASAADVARQERLVAYFEENPGVLYRVLYSLARMGRGYNHTIKTLTLAPEALDTRWRRVTFGLFLLPFCSVLGLFISARVFLLALVGSLAVNFIATYLLKANTNTYRAVYPLSNLVRQSKKIAADIRGGDEAMAAQIHGCLGVCKKAGLPLTLMWFSDFFEQMAVPDITGIFLLPMVSYFSLVRFVQRETDALAALVALIGQADVACAVYSFRKSVPCWAKPVYTEEKRIAADGVYHPLLPEPVANSIDTGQSVLLTGSNASGKSTFLKTIAVNLILAQSINTVCARALCLKKAEVVTAMAVSDSIFEGDSYFMAEIKAMKRLVRGADEAPFSYLFIDEILRGTNTVERIAAASAFLEYLDRETVLCFAASHDIELVGITSPAYGQFHFAETFAGGEIQFSYRLQAGPSKTRNAIQLLEVEGFPKTIPQKARDRIQAFEATGLWHAT